MEKNEENKKRGLKLFFLQARCGIIANLFEDIASMVNGKQKGKGTICELCLMVHLHFVSWFNTVLNSVCFTKA